MRKYPIKDFAKILGVALRTVYNWRDKGLHVSPVNGTDCVDFADWARFYVSGAVVRGEGKNLDGAFEKARLTRAQADREELRLAEAKKLLLPADKVASAWTSAILAFRSRILAVPDRIHSITSDQALQTELKAMLYEALEELSRPGAVNIQDQQDGPEELDDEEPDEDDEPC